MKFLPVMLHGLMLTVVNVGAVLVGFACYKISGISYQLAAQVPAAVLVSVAGFALWYVYTWLFQAPPNVLALAAVAFASRRAAKQYGY